MQPVYSRAQLEALQVPVLERLTLHLDDETYPLVRVDTGQRSDVAALARVQRATRALTFTTQWIGGVPRAIGAPCWLVVEVARPVVAFALAFPLPSALADLADVAISRTLTLLLDDGLDQAASVLMLDKDRLLTRLATSLTLRLDTEGCHRLAQYLVGWAASTGEGKGQWRAN
jgi:hypothetical protein